MRCGWGKPLTAAGEEIAIHGYQRYDAPCCQTPFDADEMTVSCGGATLQLDFQNNTRQDA